MRSRYRFENDEHEVLRSQVRRFARDHIAPHASAWDEQECFPEALYAEAARAGITGIGYPESLGGEGGDLRHALVASDELVRTGQNVGVVVGLGTHCIGLPPILSAGTDAQKARFVPPVLSGDAVSALAITEPTGGSDVAALQTHAELRGDCYVINGRKTLISSGCRAHLITTAIRTGAPGHRGISLIVIERGTPGFEVTRRLPQTGCRSSDTAELSFDDCRVPRANLLGAPNTGFATLVRTFMTERVMLAAQCVAVAQLAYDEAVSYSGQRVAFGSSLRGFQVIRHKLADMATRIASARALTGEAIEEAADGAANPGLAAMAKNAASDMCSAVVDQAVQIHGGAGYLRGTLVERLYRDARLYSIGGGTREIMNEIIGKAEGY